MNYEQRDTYGMYKVRAAAAIGSDAHNGRARGYFGEIKEIMLDMRGGTPVVDRVDLRRRLGRLDPVRCPRLGQASSCTDF